MPAATTTWGARGGRLVKSYVEALLIAVLVAVFFRTFVLQAFKIPSRSMAEGLVVGDHLLVNKLIFGDPRPPTGFWSRFLPVRSPRRGDVIVFRDPRDPNHDFIKRCIGLPGDTVEIVDKALVVNNTVVDDGGYASHTDPRVFARSRFLDERYRNRDNFGPLRVPLGQYFFLGDNRDRSNDSRFWGMVSADAIKGRAWLIYWSTAADSAGSRDKIDLRSGSLARWAADVRWDRCFRLVR